MDENIVKKLIQIGEACPGETKAQLAKAQLDMLEVCFTSPIMNIPLCLCSEHKKALMKAIKEADENYREAWNALLIRGIVIASEDLIQIVSRELLQEAKFNRNMYSNININ